VQDLSNMAGHGSIAAPASRVRYLIDLAMLLSTAFCVGITLGLFPPLLALNVEAHGVDAFWNSVLDTAQPMAGILACPFIPRIIARIGYFNSFILGSAISAIASWLFPAFRNFWFWTALRFAMGVGMGLQWVAGEAWISRLAAGPRRGFILSIYVVFLSAGLTAGPLVLQVFGTFGAAPFVVGGVVLATTAVPLIFSRRSHEDEAAGGAGLGVQIVLHGHVHPLVAELPRNDCVEARVPLDDNLCNGVPDEMRVHDQADALAHDFREIAPHRALRPGAAIPSRKQVGPVGAGELGAVVADVFLQQRGDVLGQLELERLTVLHAGGVDRKEALSRYPVEVGRHVNQAERTDPQGAIDEQAHRQGPFEALRHAHRVLLLETPRAPFLRKREQLRHVLRIIELAQAFAILGRQLARSARFQIARDEFELLESRFIELAIMLGDPGPAPAPEALVHRHPLAILLRHVAPRRPGADAPQDAIDDRPVVAGWAVPAAPLRRQ